MSSPSPSETTRPLVLDLDARLPGAWGLAASLVGVHLVTGGVLLAAGASPFAAFLGSRSPAERALVGGQTFGRVDAGEWWRLATSVCLHADALHLAVNVLSLVALGRLLEPFTGAARWLGWFAVGGVAGSVASQAMGLPRSDGASAGAFALLGALLVLGVRFRYAMGAEDRKLYGPVMWAMTLANLILSFALPFVDATSHLGGWLVGMVLALVPRGWVEHVVVTAAFGMFVGMVAAGWVVG